MKDSGNSINALVKHALTAFMPDSPGEMTIARMLFTFWAEKLTYGWQCLETNTGRVWDALKLHMLQEN